MTRGRGRGRGRGSGGGRSTGAGTVSSSASTPAAPPASEQDICFICAEPVRLYSLPPCNHRVCHICAMRLRALWKWRNCTFCKAEATRVIFTSNDTKSYGAFTPDELPYVDEKLSIYFETKQDYDDTILLLRFQCPKPNCETLCSGWSDLKGHAKREHTRLLCDLCIKHKKIFAHEHTLFTSASLQAHLSSEHRYCEYCHQHFYSDDELWVHMRDKHEQCHICKAHSENEDERWRYYQDYRMLEQHFLKAHFLCPAPQCLERKFVVFENQMELQVHQVEEHGHTLSQRERRDALRVDTSFMYDDRPSRRSQRSSRQQRQDQASRRAQFGRTLTTTDDHEDDDWSSVLTVLNGSQLKLTSCKAALHAYGASETNVHDLLKTIANLTGDVHATDLVVQCLSGLLKHAEKRTELHDTWTAVKHEQTSFPSLPSSSHVSIKSAAPRTQQAPPRTQAQFPSLQASRVPGSAQNVQHRVSHTPWSGSSAKATPGSSADAFPPLSGPARRPVAPQTVQVSRPSKSRHAPLSSAQFPSLPTSSAHAERQAQKRELLGNRAANPLLPAPPSSRWGSSSSSAASNDDFPALGSMQASLPEPTQATSSGGKQRRRKAVLLSSVGPMHHV